MPDVWIGVRTVSVKRGTALLVVAVLVTLGSAGGCGAAVQGFARGASDGSAMRSTGSEPPWVPTAAGPYKAGDCVETGTGQVGCDKPHHFEIMTSADLPAELRPSSYPPPTGPLKPGCVVALTHYLSSPDALASRLETVVMFPNRAGWDGGERWYACLVTERGPDNNAVHRTGSLAGVLQNGLGAFQRCLVGEPLDSPLQVVGCDQPHRSEAVPGVLVLGGPTDPAPDIQRVMVDRIIPHCDSMVNVYLSGERAGVRSSGVAPDSDGWDAGNRTAVCYAKADAPTTGPMGHG
jgi:hypothetical protein